jgi:hypothetical protein
MAAKTHLNTALIIFAATNHLNRPRHKKNNLRFSLNQSQNLLIILYPPFTLFSKEMVR